MLLDADWGEYRRKKENLTMSVNISLIGNLGKAPETKITDKGTFVASFSMASNSVRNTSDGPVEKTNWFRVIAFGKQAETIARYVQKGNRICVQGRLTFNPWLDRNGSPQAGADVVLQEFQFLPNKRREEVAAGDEMVPVAASEVQEISQQTAAY